MSNSNNIPPWEKKNINRVVYRTDDDNVEVSLSSKHAEELTNNGVDLNQRFVDIVQSLGDSSVHSDSAQPPQDTRQFLSEYGESDGDSEGDQLELWG